jgi:hypothetical protein
MGRVACYTAKRVTWQFLTGQSKLDLFPSDELKWDGQLPADKFAVPGESKLV